MISATSGLQKKLGIAAWALSALGLILSVRCTSLWIDEGQTYFIINNSLSGFLNGVLFRGDAVSGMPLFFLFEFFWCRIFGFSEFAMRSINLLMIPLLLIGAGKLLRSKGLPQWMIVFFAFNPVLLYYMNEARPYVAMFVCGLWCFLFLFRGGENGMSRRDTALFFLCFWTGCALHMMFIFMGAAYLGMLIWMKYKGVLRFREHFRVWAWSLPAFLILGGHYLRFLMNAPEVNAEKPQAVMSILQICYFFSGVSGLGWSRNALRCMNVVMSPRIAVETGLFVLSAVIVVFCCIRRKVFLKSELLLPAGCIAGSLILFIGSNLVLRTRFWERHIIYLLPGCIFVAVMACYALWSLTRGAVARTSVCCFLALLIVSSLNISWMGYYQKDDYRGAVKLARSFNADHILFQGATTTFRYYGIEGRRAELKIKSEDDTPLEGDLDISLVSSEEMDVLARRINGRSVLILSEKDEYDKGGFYKRSLGMAGLHTESFVVFAVDSVAEEWLAAINGSGIVSSGEAQEKTP